MPNPIPCNARIPHITRGFHPKYSQALRAVAECVWTWVDDADHRAGVRNLTLAEMREKRALAAELRDGLPPKEIHGVTERLPGSRVWTPQTRYEVLSAAREFYRQATT